MRLTLLSLALATASFAAAASAPATSNDVTCSFYSSRYNGRSTASGQRFNNASLTAASRDLPLGTKIKVTNLANNRSVVVRVNDRGPFVKGRDLSVTRGAAQRLGFIKSGTAHVRITPVS